MIELGWLGFHKGKFEFNIFPFFCPFSLNYQTSDVFFDLFFPQFCKFPKILFYSILSYYSFSVARHLYFIFKIIFIFYFNSFSFSQFLFSSYLVSSNFFQDSFYIFSSYFFYQLLPFPVSSCVLRLDFMFSGQFFSSPFRSFHLWTEFLPSLVSYCLLGEFLSSSVRSCLL